MPALLFSDTDAEEAMKSIVAGEYNRTIHLNFKKHIEFFPEELIIIASSRNFAVEAGFEGVSYHELGDISDDASWITREKNYLRFRFKLSPHTSVSLIRWGNLSGKLVDEYRAKERLCVEKPR